MVLHFYVRVLFLIIQILGLYSLLYNQHTSINNSIQFNNLFL